MSTIKITGLTSSGAIVGNVILPMVGNVAGTLTTLRGTVDQLKTFITAGAEANISLGNTIQSAQLTAANLGIIGYVDNKVSTANIGMKGYVDSVANQSIYTNSNVLAYLTQFDGDIIPSGNLIYSLGSHTNRWKDLHLGSSTIYIGNTAISSTASGTISVTPKIVLVDTSITSNDLAFPWAITQNPEVLANTSSSVSATLVFANTISADTTSQSLTYGIDYEIVPTGDGYANIRLIGLNISSPPVGWPGYGQLTIIETPPAGGTTDISGNLTVSGNIANIRLGASGRITFADGTVQTTTANAGVIAANLGMIGYVDSRITAANAGVTTANIGIIGYVDNAVSTANVGMNGFVNLVIDTANIANAVVTQSVVSANLGMKGYVDNSVINSTANIAMKGYVDLANTIQSAQISAANLGMKGYVDSVASQSIYGNSNVKSYLTGGFDGNIIPSANVTYSLGSITNQWKDLYVSSNTIYIGGSQLSVAGNGLSINGSKISASKSAPANAEGRSGDTIGDVAINEFTGNAYTPIYSYYCKQTYAGEVIYSGINGTSGGQANGVLLVDVGSQANMGNVRVGWIMYGSPITGNATITSIIRGPGSPGGSPAWRLTIDQAVDLKTATNITVQGRPAIWLRSAVLDDWGTT